MFSDDESDFKVSYWPSVSDLFMTLFIITVALLGAVILVFLPSPKEDDIVVAEIVGPLNMIREQLNELLPLDVTKEPAEIIVSIEDTAETLRKTLEHYRNQIAKLTSGEENFVDELLILQSKIDLLQSTILKVQQENENLITEVERLQSDILKAQQEKEKLITEVERLQSDNLTAQQESEILVTEIENIKADIVSKYVVIDEVDEIRALLDRSRDEVNMLEEQIVTLKKGMRLEDKPPIITIADADKRHFFASGSAEVSPEFVTDLDQSGFQEIAAEILKRNQGETQAVDTLEIIGHTDGIPVAQRGNLDAVLPEVLDGAIDDFKKLSPGSNNDLGLLRAIAIKHAWQRFVDDQPDAERKMLGAISVRTYSAGQTLPVETGGYRAADARSRRIELRLTKLQ